MINLTGEEKGALLLKNLAPAVVEKILARLGPERSSRMRQIMARFENRPDMQTTLDALMVELQEAMKAKKKEPIRPPVVSVPLKPPAPPGKPAMSQPPPSASPLRVEKEPPSPPPVPPVAKKTSATLADLVRLPAERIAMALEGESPRTIALLLNYVDVGLAGAVYKRLNPAVRDEVSVQFSILAMPSLEVLERIGQALLQKLERLTQKPVFPEGAARVRKMADMLRQIDKIQRVQVLETLQKKDAALAAEIKSLLYRFDDVRRIEARSLQKVLGEIDTKALAAALKDAAEDIKEKFLSNLSKRAAENLIEEMELSQNVAKEEIEQAQKEIVAVIQRLDLAGELVMTEW